MQGRSHIFINGTASVSPQRTFDGTFLPPAVNYTGNVLTCQAPDFKAYIPPAQLRRLGRMLRIGVTAGLMCLRHARVENPDGIITATGYGFLEDTEKFLREIIDRKEQQLTPTLFMQGTYNALAGLIGLSIQCTGYNNTYVSRGYALGSALDDAMIQIADNPTLKFLVGAYDEAVSVQYKSVAREGHFKKEKIDSLTLFNHATPGSLQGEGCAFFLLAGERTAQTLCTLTGVRGIFRPQEDLREAILDFLGKHALSPAELDLWISGHSGDIEKDRPLHQLGDDLLREIPQARFKHLVGEYCTADGFALWLGAMAIKTQTVPDVIRYGKMPPTTSLRSVLIVNHYIGKNYVMYLLQHP